jgi:hypothetical protein
MLPIVPLLLKNSVLESVNSTLWWEHVTWGGEAIDKELDESEGAQKVHCYEMRKLWNVTGTSRGLYSGLINDGNVNSESR